MILQLCEPFYCLIRLGVGAGGGGGGCEGEVQDSVREPYLSLRHSNLHSEGGGSDRLNYSVT